MEIIKIFEDFNDNIISRKIVSSIINYIKNDIYYKVFTFDGIVIKYNVTNNDENMIDSYCDKESITINIKTNYNYSILYFSLLFSIRHEIEHLRQNKKSIFYKNGRVRNSYHSEDIKADTIFKYLKLIDEKEANIKAIYLISKKLKLTFDKSFEFFIKDIEKLSKYRFSNKEYSILKNIYKKISLQPKYNFKFIYE